MIQTQPRPLHVVVGASGQVGAHLVTVLEASGQCVRRVARRAIAGGTSEVAKGDIGDPDDAVRLCQGAHVVYACFGGPHRTWAEQFPRMAGGVIQGARRAGARLVFADNLYAYGPQPKTLTEGTAVRPQGPKQRLRAAIADLFLEQHTLGNLPVTIARASDLYGPGVNAALLDLRFIRAAVEGKTLRLPGNPNVPHTFSFAPDVARALARLGTAEDSWGEIWHVPSAPAASLSSVVVQLGELAGTSPRVARLSRWMVRAVGLVNRDVRELLELSYQWERPYLVSHAKFTTRYGLEPTSLRSGLRATIDSLKP